MTQSRTKIASSFVLAFALLAACGQSTEINQTVAMIVQDKAALPFVQRFRIRVIRATDGQGIAVRCADFPINEASLQLQVVATATIPWGGQQEEATSGAITVPGNESLVFVVEAFGLYALLGEDHVILRGCLDGQTFAPGAVVPPLEIDVRATTGGPCTQSQECGDPRLFCTLDTNLPGGYCARQVCGNDGDCPPGSACINNQVTNGLCARVCEGPADCNTVPQQQTCLQRSGPDGCKSVCVPPPFNAAQACTP